MPNLRSFASCDGAWLEVARDVQVGWDRVFKIHSQPRKSRALGGPVKITDVTTIKLSYDMPVPMADAIHYMPSRPTLLVQVHTDAGIVGLGESAAYGGFLESTEALVTGELRQT